MAKPIEHTPVLEGNDALKFVKELVEKNKKIAEMTLKEIEKLRKKISKNKIGCKPKIEKEIILEISDDELNILLRDFDFILFPEIEDKDVLGMYVFHTNYMDLRVLVKKKEEKR